MQQRGVPAVSQSNLFKCCSLLTCIKKLIKYEMSQQNFKVSAYIFHVLFQYIGTEDCLCFSILLSYFVVCNVSVFSTRQKILHKELFIRQIYQNKYHVYHVYKLYSRQNLFFCQSFPHTHSTADHKRLGLKTSQNQSRNSIWKWMQLQECGCSSK